MMHRTPLTGETAGWRCSFVERQLAIRYRWNLRAMRAPDRKPRNAGEPYFWIANAEVAFPRLLPRIEALQVTRWSLFGNAVHQLCNLAFACERYGVRAVHLPGPHPFFAGDRMGDIDLDWSGAPIEGGPLTLVGRFFVMKPLRLHMTSRNVARLIVKYVRPLMTASIRQIDPRVGDDDLVVHFRAGDLFSEQATSRGVGSDYGQPPLAFYLEAIKREKPKRVCLVFEDRGNPCVDLAEAALRAAGIETVLQSASLADDLRVLLSARRLVIGRGTFAQTAAALSGRARKIYAFDNDKMLRRLGIEIVYGQDLRGDYKRSVLSNTWTASPAQRELLASYPAEAIGFTELGPLKP